MVVIALRKGGAEGPRSRRIVRHIEDNLRPTALGREYLKAPWPPRLANSHLNRFRRDSRKSALGQLLRRSHSQGHISQLVPSHQRRIHENLFPHYLHRVPASERWLAILCGVRVREIFPGTRYQVLPGAAGGTYCAALTPRAAKSRIALPITSFASACCGRVTTTPPGRMIPTFSRAISLTVLPRNF